MGCRFFLRIIQRIFEVFSVRHPEDWPALSCQRPCGSIISANGRDLIDKWFIKFNTFSPHSRPAKLRALSAVASNKVAQRFDWKSDREPPEDWLNLSWKAGGPPVKRAKTGGPPVKREKPWLWKKVATVKPGRKKKRNQKQIQLSRKSGWKN